MMATVTNLKPALEPKPARGTGRPRASTAKPRGVRRAAGTTARRRMAQGALYGALALALTALSLSHLAEGVALVAHRPAWEGWVIAAAIDVGFVAAELTPFTVGPAAAHDTRWHTRGLSVVVLCASAAFNAAAFAEHSSCPYAAIAIGVAVPGFVATFLSLAGRCLLGRRA